ncbi:Cationic amino acid transporter 6, chloroplastic [Vitis vinifera]|uniref:Cationic amino acid transporter 6, chloroplastic n=1 Tax=Vitis vinifera TaxID=29760 RepID=A0A438K2N4_VITVI|nr:Cationic amino acid transporter 6, chloroplastic [Vitis vinifera]
MAAIQTALSSIFFSKYLHSLSQTPHRLRKRMLATWTSDQELNQVRLRSGADMKRKLGWYDLVALGVGGMLGVGVFVTTGPVALHHSGPSVFISYIIAGISALLSSMCYTEFSVEIPVAGGAFSYLRVTFGEFVGYFAGANILMEYVLSNAAVSRSFTEYLSCAFGGNLNSWRVEVHGFTKGFNMLDFPAVAIILLLTLCLCYRHDLFWIEKVMGISFWDCSTKESSILNFVMTIFHVVFFGFIIIAGFLKGSAKNLVNPDGLAPFGVKGVLDGAAQVYFSYIGYDSVSTMAEEISNPSKSLPVGIMGSVFIVSGLYCLMSFALCMMLPYNQIPEKASFAIAFQRMGWKWASNIVGAGASLGIVASLLVAMLGQARYLCVIGRARLVPLWLAKVHPSTGTPLNATLFLGAFTASIALFTELEIVVDMVNLCTLLLNCLFPVMEAQAMVGSPLFGGIMIIITACFHYFAPYPNQPSKWSVPFMPWPAAMSIFLNVFLMTTLKKLSLQRFGVWSCLIILFYVLYGVHSTYRAEEMGMDAGGVNPNSSAQQTKLDIQLL